MKIRFSRLCCVVILTVFVTQSGLSAVRTPNLTPRYSGAMPNEWTMDYEAALAYAETNELNTIVMFAAPWWCGDCQNLEDVVLTNSQWLAYIDANPVMLVLLDFNLRPAYGFPPDHPYNKCFLSDADYLTANGLTEVEGDARLAYNYSLQEAYCVPSLLAKNGYSKVPYPSWIVHRPDGTRAGRMNLERSQNPTPQSVIRKYEQTLLADAADEMDDEALMAPSRLDFPLEPSPLNATLSETDLADNYIFRANSNQCCYFSITGGGGTAPSSVAVSIIGNLGTNVLQHSVVDLESPVVVQFRPDSSAPYFLKIESEDTQTNLVGYALSAEEAYDLQSFEAGYGIWTSSAASDFEWTRHSGATPSPGTGPDAASDGSFYLYAEASGNTPSQVAAIEAGFDFSDALQPVLIFDYHMYGGLMGSLHVDVYDGTAWTESICSLSGQQQSSSSSPWKTAEVDLTSLSGVSNAVVRFRAVTGTYYLSDVAIDRVCLVETAFEEFALDVTDGSGDGSYRESFSVAVTADAPPQGFDTFSHWTVTPEEYSQNLENPKAAQTMFAMPAENVTLAPNYISRPLVTPRCSGAQPNQWTTDYEAAMAYAEANGLNTIVMFTAEWWCPYCKALEEKVLTDSNWLAYIDANPVMLVMLDYEIRPVYQLPRDDPRNRCFYWDEQYLADNGLTEVMGDARLAYNYSLQDAYCVPSLRAFYGYARVPYPSWIVHRPDGSRSSRMKVSDFREESVTPEMAVAAVIRRYEQALLSDPADEMDDEALMSPQDIAVPAQEGDLIHMNGTLSENDLADNFCFEAVSNEVYTIIFDSQAVLPGTSLSVSLISTDGVSVVESALIDPATTNMFVVSGLSAAAYYLKVSPTDSLTNLCGYIMSMGNGPFVSSPTPVPCCWMDQFTGMVLGGDYMQAAFDDQDNDGMLTWEEFVAGTVPTNGNSRFIATIDSNASGLLIGWDPDLRPNREYQVEGKETLADDWAPTNSASRFFKVKVFMP